MMARLPKTQTKMPRNAGGRGGVSLPTHSVANSFQERDIAYHTLQCRDTAYHAPRHVDGDLKQIVASTPCSIESVPINSDNGPPGFSQKVVRAAKRISLKPLRTPPFDRLPPQQIVRSQMEMLVE